MVVVVVVVVVVVRCCQGFELVHGCNGAVQKALHERRDRVRLFKLSAVPRESRSELEFSVDVGADEPYGRVFCDFVVSGFGNFRFGRGLGRKSSGSANVGA